MRTLRRSLWTLGSAAGLFLFGAGCADIQRELTISDATDEELRSVLLRPTDLPGWTVEPMPSNPEYERAQQNAVDSLENDNFLVCDIDGGVDGDLFSNYELSLAASATAERVCGDKDTFISNIADEEDRYRDASRQLLASNLAQAGIALSDHSFEAIDLGLGPDTLSYRTTATLTGPDGDLAYESLSVAIFSEKVATTLIVEGYGVTVPRNEIKRLVGLIQARQGNI